MPGSALFIASCMILLAAVTSPAGAAVPGEGRGNRGDVLEELDGAQARWDADRADPVAVSEYATLLMECGRFEDSREVLEPLLQSAERPLEAVQTASRLAYFMGDFESAEPLFKEVLARDPGNRRALTGLIFVYYQTNEYQRWEELSRDALEGVRLPHLDLMRAFGSDRPWQLTWADGPETEVPFLQTDPLPVIEVEIGGRKIAALIDTGGDLLVIDPGVADTLGIEPAATMMGMFAGGMQAEVGFAKVDRVRLGGATLRSVPVSILPTRGIPLADRPIEGIVGTQVLKQFLSTLDYPRGRLILRERSETSSAAFRNEIAGRVADEIPFYLQGTHFLLAHGSLNGYTGLVFHIDSGLAGEAAFGAPEETLEYVGIPVPDVEVHEESVGGGGGGFATGAFPVAELGLGDLEQHNLIGSFGGLPPGSYWSLGFILDGLVSHNFLRAYAWTLDFDSMRMVFVK